MITEMCCRHTILPFYARKLWKEREKVSDEDKPKYIYEDAKIVCFNTGLYDKTWQLLYFTA